MNFTKNVGTAYMVFRISDERKFNELLEKHGIDALVVPSLSDDERRAAFAAGIMFLPGFSGEPQQAALAFLSGAIGFDPNNPCNACGHNGGCSMECGSCSLKK